MATEDGIISSSSEAAVAGFKAVKKVTGTLQPLERKESTFTNENEAGEKVPAKDQIQLALEDAFILEMLDDQPVPELRDDKFVDWLPYAKKGEQPTKQSGFVRGFTKSAEKLMEARGKPGCGWRDLVGETVTLERKPIDWTFNKGKDNEETKTAMVWHFVEGEDLAEGLDEYVAKIVEGKTPQMAARGLMMDARTKNNAEFRNAVRAQQPIAGLEVISGKYQLAGGTQEATEDPEA